MSTKTLKTIHSKKDVNKPMNTKGKTETWEVGRVKGCMRAGLCEKHHMVHPCPEIKITETWVETFRKFHNDNVSGGSSRWLVAPNIVEVFIREVYQQGVKDGKNSK